ncbi:hypothetical protein [Paraburkholderia sp. JPY419]|uniref:hypothetical protein n=1 Tax=Paraburkholderia sp. JPY419 TaxID=667660 RepID=UPI003D1EFA15
MLIETFISFFSAQEHESHDRSAGEAKRFERLTNSGYPYFSCLYGTDAFCKLLFRDVETVCMHVSGLPDGRLPKHARSLDEIRAPRP